jgi:hypothetical protein
MAAQLGNQLEETSSTWQPSIYLHNPGFVPLRRLTSYQSQRICAFGILILGGCLNSQDRFKEAFLTFAGAFLALGGEAFRQLIR